MCRQHVKLAPKTLLLILPNSEREHQENLLPELDMKFTRGSQMDCLASITRPIIHEARVRVPQIPA